MAGQANDTEKLPWLEPYREPAASARRTKSKPKLESVAATDAAPASVGPPKTRRGVPLAVWLGTAIAVVGVAAATGFWAGRGTAPTSAVPTAPTVTIPVAKVDPIPMPEVTEPAAGAETTAPTTRKTMHRVNPERRAPVRKTAQSAPPRPDTAPPMPKVMAIRFSAPPSAGKPGTVVDLGRYLSPTLADSAYRVTVGRYPYLSGLTKVVAPQPPVYGQPRLYALQLGARSPTEARQLCNNLRRIGRPCLVR